MEIVKEHNTTTIEEEMDMTLECVSKIRGHFNRLINEEKKLKYVNNLMILDSMFVNYDKTVNEAVAV